MVEVKVNMDRATELVDKYSHELYDSGFSKPSGDKIEMEEPIAKISACLHTAASIGVGITFGTNDDVDVLFVALSRLIDVYLSTKGIKYVSE